MKLLILGVLLSTSAFAQFDQEHTLLTNVLKKFTSKVGPQTSVNYKALKADDKELQDYLDQLESVTKDEFDSFTSDQQLSFWINAYNAYTLDAIIDNYPVKTITKITKIRGVKKGLLDIATFGPWDLKFIKLFGKKMSLNNIEHDTIRKDFQEARIHFAVNCASIGCPSLFQEAFVANRLEEQLEAATINFVTNKSKNFIEGDTFMASEIFKWYGNDFKAKYDGWKKFVLKYLSKDEIDKVKNFDFNDYDWSLNQVK